MLQLYSYHGGINIQQKLEVALMHIESVQEDLSALFFHLILNFLFSEIFRLMHTLEV